MSSPEVLVDTGAWFALQVPDDRHHQAAASALPGLLARAGRLVTTRLVLSETYTLLRVKVGWEAAWRFLERVERSPRTEVAPLEAGLEPELRRILQDYREHPFSYADAASFALMRERGMRYAFAFDTHFATAGFVRIPVDVPELPEE